MLQQLGEPYDKPFLYVYVISYTFLLITLLSGYYLNVTQLLAYSSIYLAMITVSLTFMRGVENGKIVEGTVISIIGLFAVTFIFGFITRNFRIMGTFQLQPMSLMLLAIPPQTVLQAMMVIPNATAEESFFRIGLYHMLKAVMPKHWAILTQAILFGIFHYYAYAMNVAGIITAAAAGTLLGIIYDATGSEFALTFAHTIYNIVALFGGA